jgi:hypothetical protein
MLTLIALATLAGSTIKLEPVGDQWIVRAMNAGDAALSVGVESAGSDLPPLLGTQTTVGRDRIFTPRFPLQPGVRYRAVVANGSSFVFEIPAATRSASQPKVATVYPTAAVLPENQLKLYLEFATPMTRGEAYRRIRLLDADGRPIELPFLELDEELWDARLQRLTLYFDPGRVKSDLVPNRALGSPLRAGQRYTLVVTPGWKDAQGQVTTSEFRKAFSVGPRDAASPDPAQWRIHTPAPGSRGPIAIDFSEPMEHALATRMIEVRDATNRIIAGEIVLGREESHWSFTPDEAWTAGRYSLVVDAALEDLAGNKVSRPFEVGIRTDEQRKAAPTSVSVPIRIGSRD